MSVSQSDPRTRLIETAAERGIISAAQLDAMRALMDEAVAGPSPAVEAPRGFNAVTVAYVVGAMLVVFAFGWILVDRWQTLGPWGVLLVVLTYVVLLLACTVWLERREYRQASGIALMLATGLTPILTWAVLSIAGIWPEHGRSDPLSGVDRIHAGCWALIDLTVLIAAGGALRWRRHVALTIPLTVGLWALWLHLTQAIAGPYAIGTFDKWTFLAGGLCVCAIAGEVERWQGRVRSSGQTVDGDFAFFFWLGGLFAFAVAYMAIWFDAHAWKHLMPLIGLILIVLALYLRRRTHLAFGLLALFGYLAYLATEVFRDYLSLPAILGTLGVLLILLTVWGQRRFPKLAERVNSRREGALLPPMVTRGPLILAVGIALLSLTEAKEERAQREFRHRFYEMRRKNDSLRSARPGAGPAAAPLRDSVTAQPRP